MPAYTKLKSLNSIKTTLNIGKLYYIILLLIILLILNSLYFLRTKTVNSDFVARQYGSYSVLENYVRATQTFKDNQSITLSIPGEFNTLDNLIPLVEHWDGPISVAVYAPGSDFQKALNTIAYLRNCENHLIRSLVTFHIFFKSQHFPKSLLRNAYVDDFNCDLPPIYKYFERVSYRISNNLVYPTNLARNIAKNLATTHYLLISDFQLYPSKNFVFSFLKMINENNEILQDDERNHVFVLPIFEIGSSTPIPKTKTELVRMISDKEAFSFRSDYTIPYYEDWITIPETKELDTSYIVKREYELKNWQSYYVETQKEPSYELTFVNDKISKEYTLCLLEYNFRILNNAFIIYKPGSNPIIPQDAEYLFTPEYLEVKKNVTNKLNRIFGYKEKC